MNQKELADAIKTWFLAKQNNKNKWNDNIVGRTIQSELQKTGNWRIAPNGNPRKAHQAMMKTLYEQQEDQDYDN